METWKTNLDETKKRYIDWWNHKGIILNMWEHFQEDVKPHADIPAPSPAKDLNQKWFDPQWRAEYLDWYVAHSSLKADIKKLISAFYYVKYTFFKFTYCSILSLIYCLS